MRRAPAFFGIAALAGALASASTAAPLVSSSLSISMASPDMVFVGVGASGTSTSNLAATLHLTGAFTGSATATVTGAPATAYPFEHVRMLLKGSAGATFVGTTPANVGGNATFTGTASFFLTGAFPSTPFVKVPLEIGKTASNTFMGSGLAVSTFGAPWTAGPAKITGVAVATPNGATVTAVTVTGNNALTPNGNGVLTLVSLGKVYVSTGEKVPIIGRLTLNFFVPEPATFLLLGSGAVGLGLLGRRRSLEQRRVAQP